METRIFLPGYAARARTYEPGLPDGWMALQPPFDVLATGSLGQLRDWLVRELEYRPAPAVLAGHSMGATLALLAAADAPERVSGLVLVAPAGLPLTKPLRRCLYDLLRNVKAGRVSASDVAVSTLDLAKRPRAAARLAQTLRRLDVSPAMMRVREAGVPATVIGCSTDTLTTPESSRRAARLLAARYRELRLEGGHLWMFGSWDLLARELEDGLAPAASVAA
jgi:pimeloyl-ACP methyl ester carboxylesterase